MTQEAQRDRAERPHKDASALGDAAAHDGRVLGELASQGGGGRVQAQRLLHAGLRVGHLAQLILADVALGSLPVNLLHGRSAHITDLTLEVV